MQCEVCGRSIRGQSYKAIIEGARLVVCSDCAVLGSISWEMRTLKPAKPAAKIHRLPLKHKSKVSAKRRSPLKAALELVEDFDTRIRRARETQGLNHEELGGKINEKISVIRKLESHKIRPDNKLAEKLQHALKIKLLVPATEKKFPKKLLTTIPPSKTITLGDLIKSKEKPEATK